MKLDLPIPGTYVVAVSGGVDSVALLHVLSQHPELTLIVAHYDHGIRKDSEHDRQLVQKLAQSYGLPFVYDKGRLGKNASEATARTARYAFLRRTRSAAQARAIITAHHQDDVLETAILNIMRGTGRKGLASLGNAPTLVRPLLAVPKQALLQYAQQHDLHWHEDSTNTDQTYLRNYVRHTLLAKFSQSDRERLLSYIRQAHNTNQDIDNLLAAHLHLQSRPSSLDRRKFVLLPHAVAREVMAAWLRGQGVRTFDRPMVERLVVAAKVAVPNKRYPVVAGAFMQTSKTHLALIRQER